MAGSQYPSLLRCSELSHPRGWLSFSWCEATGLFVSGCRLNPFPAVCLRHLSVGILSRGVLEGRSVHERASGHVRLCTCARACVHAVVCSCWWGEAGDEGREASQRSWGCWAQQNSGWRGRPGVPRVPCCSPQGTKSKQGRPSRDAGGQQCLCERDVHACSVAKSCP